MSLREWLLALTALVLLLIVVVWARAADTKKCDPFEVAARAYHSCAYSPTCGSNVDAITPDKLLIYNPFVWPYSGTETPEKIMRRSTEPPMTQTQDHETKE